MSETIAAVIPPGYVDAGEAQRITGRHISTLNRMAKAGQVLKQLYVVPNRKPAPAFRMADLEKYTIGQWQVSFGDPSDDLLVGSAPDCAELPRIPPATAQRLNQHGVRIQQQAGFDAAAFATALLAALDRHVALPPAPPAPAKSPVPLADLLQRPTLTIAEAARVFRLTRHELVILRDGVYSLGFWHGHPGKNLKGRYLFRRADLEEYIRSL